MSTSDIKTIEEKTLKVVLGYILTTIFCAIFGAVYECFSHEVYSYFMLYAFAFPLVSAAVFLTICLSPLKKAPGPVARNLYHSGIATLTIGSIMKGVLDIYGTTNRLVGVYWIAGVALVLAGIVSYIIELKFEK